MSNSGVNFEGLIPPSVANGSVMADYVVWTAGSTVIATPANGSVLPRHEGTTGEYGTVIQAAVTSLKCDGSLHIALGMVSTNDAEIVINEGLNKANPFSPTNKLIITGNGSTQLNQGTPGKNTLKVENASTVDLSGFRLFSGPAAKSALCLSSEGAESEISAIESRIDLHCTSTSTSAPAVLMQNLSQSTTPYLTAFNSSYDGLVIENTSTTINYGNSTFGLVFVGASTSSPHAGVKIVTTHHEKFPNLLTFDSIECVTAAYYGIYTLGARNITVVKADLEAMVAPVWHDGNSEGAETTDFKILSGYIHPSGEAVAAITNTEYTAGNSCNATIEGSSKTIPITDQSINRAVNSYSLILENAAMGHNIAVTNPATQITLRRTDQGVRSPAGTNRQPRSANAPHTFEPRDMGLTLEYNNAGAGTFTIGPFSEKALPVGTVIYVRQAGAGTLTVAAGEGVTLRNPTGYTFARYGMAMLWCGAENEWDLHPVGQVLTGPWTEIAPNTAAKLEEVGTFQTCRARFENGGSRCYLRGELKVKIGEELKAGETVCTLPEGLRPPGLVNFILGGSVVMEIRTTGVVALGTAKLSTQTILLDGVNFNIT